MSDYNVYGEVELLTISGIDYTGSINSKIAAISERDVNLSNVNYLGGVLVGMADIIAASTGIRDDVRELCKAAVEYEDAVSKLLNDE